MKSPYDPPETLEPAYPDTVIPKQKSNPKLALFIFGLGAFSIAWRLLSRSHLSGSALLFIGVPLALAVLLGFTPTPGSATGKIIKGLTLFLLMIGILMVEGFICILMAAPLFYLVALIVGLCIDAFKSGRDARMNCSILGVLILFSLEGIHENLSFGRDEKVVVIQDTELTLEEAHQRLRRGPEFDLKTLPLFLKAGFPTPQEIHGQGADLGDEWTIELQGMEQNQPLTVRVTEATKTSVTFRCIENKTKVGEWMDLEEVQWQFHPTEKGTQISMTFRYRRLLDPAWYFKPLERYGVKKAGEYFLKETFLDDDD